MYSALPGEMRILSRDEVELFLPLMDLVHKEQRVTFSSRSYHISNFEYRTRKKKAAEECELRLATIEGLDADPELDPIGEWENCKEAILWGLTLQDYLVRNTLSRKICLEGILRPTWTKREELPCVRHAAWRIELSAKT